MKKLLLAVVLLSLFMVGCKKDTYVGEYKYYIPKISNIDYGIIENDRMILKEDSWTMVSGSDGLSNSGKITINENKIHFFSDDVQMIELYYVNGFLCGKYDGEIPKGNRFNSILTLGQIEYTFTEDGKYTISNLDYSKSDGKYERKKNKIILTYEVNGETVNKEFIVKDNTLYEKVMIKEQ